MARRREAVARHVHLPLAGGSQAILNGMTIVTPDENIARYPAPVLW